MEAVASSASAMLRSHGDVFLMADRKNRMERVRLDKQLRAYDRDCARNGFHIERQKRTLVNKWQGVSMTTGHSDKALPPQGPRDNVYEKCKHSQHRLSEKRLMEWKVHERQLEKFLRQFQPRPRTSPTQLKPRPSSSRAPEPRPDVMSRRSKTPEPNWIPSARAVRQGHSSASRRRRVSAVSFSSRTEIISSDSIGEQTDRISAKGDAEQNRENDEEGNSGPDDSFTGNKLHVFRSGLRSLSAASLHKQGKKGTSTSRLRPSEDSFMSEIPEETSSPPLATTLSASQVAENLKSSSRNYRAFVRARSFSGTKFFVTKDNVVMTDALQETCRELHVNESSDDCEENAEGQVDGRLLSFRNAERASGTEEMSVSSSPSEDSVFVASDDRASGNTHDGEAEDLAVVDVDELSDSGGGNVGEVANLNDADLGSDDAEGVTANFNAELDRGEASSDESDLEKDSVQNHPHVEVDAEEPIAVQTGATRSNEDEHPVDFQTVSADVEVEECEENGPASDLVPSVSIPMKKLTILENKHVGVVDDDGQGFKVVQGRRHSFLPLSQYRPATSLLGGNVRRHSLFVGRESTERSPKPVTLLMKRRQSSAALLKTPGLSDAQMDPSSVTSAMTVKPLLTKDNQQTKAATSGNKQGEDLSNSSGTSLFKLHDHNNTTADTNTPDSDNTRFRIPHLSKDPNPNPPQQDVSNETTSNPDERPSSQWRRRHDLDLEQPQGLRPSVSSLGTVIKAAMVFSKAARRRALSSLVEENTVDTREIIRRERLRKLQSRASVLSKIVSQFPVQGEE